MTRDRLITTVLAAVLALPAVADAPGYFKIPGTDIAMKFYGQADLNAVYDTVGNTGPFGGLLTAKATVPDDSVPKNQWDMTSLTTRFGVTAIAPSSWGDVTAKIEGDFYGNAASGSSFPLTDNKGNFRLRHAYGQIGPLLAGQTSTLFTDPAGVADMYMDWQGLAGCYANISSRVPQVRYTFDLTKQASLAFSMEQSKTSIPTGATKSRPFPGSLVGAFTYKEGWGHVKAAVAYQKYDGWTKATPTVGEKDMTKTSLSWLVSGDVKIGQDILAAHVGVGDGNYGPALQDGVVLNTTGTGYELIQGKLWGIGYKHTWTDKVRSHLFLSGVRYSEDRNKNLFGAKFEKYEQIGVNTLVSLTKTTRFGAEYIYGRAVTFDDNAITNADGSRTNKITESKLRLQLRFVLN